MNFYIYFHFNCAPIICHFWNTVTFVGAINSTYFKSIMNLTFDANNLLNMAVCAVWVEIKIHANIFRLQWTNRTCISLFIYLLESRQNYFTIIKYIYCVHFLRRNFSTDLAPSCRFVNKTDSLSPPTRMDVGKFNGGRAFIR